MATLADLFKTNYLTSGNGVEFADIRLHYRGVDEICRAFGAAALTIGSDIYFRREAFAPHTPRGLRLLAHEVAHVVQQRRGPVTAARAAGGLAVAGLEATMRALEIREVEELLIAARADRVTGPADELVARAQQNAARIRFIEDDTLLADVGGVGALLRFKI